MDAGMRQTEVNDPWFSRLLLIPQRYRRDPGGPLVPARSTPGGSPATSSAASGPRETDRLPQTARNAGAPGLAEQGLGRFPQVDVGWAKVAQRAASGKLPREDDLYWSERVTMGEKRWRIPMADGPAHPTTPPPPTRTRYY